MDFHASPAVIEDFSEILGKQEEHTEAAERYAKAHLEISDQSDGIIAELLTTHDQLQAQINEVLAQLKAVCVTNTKAMAATARYYRNTDETVARQFENKLPETQHPPVTPFVGPFVLRETMVPEGRLTPPQSAPEPLDPMAVIDALNNLTSPGWYAANVLEVLIGVNPADEVSKWIAGDWEAFSKCCGAFNSLGFFCSDIGVNIMDNHRLLLNAWSGKAADGSYDYFNRLATSLEQHKDAFVKLKGEYEKVAAGVREFAKVAGDLVQDIFDKVFWIVAEAVAGGVMAESVVAPAVLWAVAAWQCMQVVKTWGRIGELFQALSYIVRTAKGEILMVMSDSGFKAHPLPGSYGHPALI
ncbi:hypothetical protein ABZ345_25710 [Lentzea sp. NPDC005914]|uniref:hypothetical protein n=1 Tax=Lentzea sp. NPDC005914 TaxID=3154572 RepID=UPI0033E72F23